MFGAFTSFGKLGALASSVARAWSPLALWPDGIATPGMWISPRDLTSQWQDYAGTTPVATPGSVADSANPVGLALDIRAGATTVSDPGNHMLQSTSAARPLESAYDGQTLGPGNTYDATGITPFQLYDGVDDGMATASFAAGTLINGMDCMIAVRQDSASTTLVAGLYDQPGTSWTGFSSLDYPTAPVAGNAGSPAVWVDGVQLSGGTSVTAGTLHTALTTGSWHILEMRGLDLSTWTSLKYGDYVTAMLNGARGDILLYPSTASTADKDAARQYLADKYGVTLA